MTGRSQSTTCAFCGERFPVVRGHILSWRVGDRYACNEFCAEGVEAQSSPLGALAAAAQSSASRAIAALFSRQ